MLISGSLFGTNVIAANGQETYFGFQYAQIDEDDLDLEPTVGIFRIGSMGENGVGFEGRIGVGLSDDDISETDPFLGDISLELEVDTVLGLYLVGQTTAGGVISVYGIVGFTMVDYTLDLDLGILGSGSDSDDESDLSYGFGANFDVSDKVSLNIEFMQYLDKDDFEASAISVGVLF
jgi:opacity protein-like surface antigen